MKKSKLISLIIGGMATAFWIYFNIATAFSAENNLTAVIIYCFMAVLFVIPFILAWQWARIAGWLYVILAIFLGGGYYYLIFFIAEKSYDWWIWLIMLLLFLGLPLSAGILLIKSDKKPVTKS